jgi:hypothetical protein
MNWLRQVSEKQKSRKRIDLLVKNNYEHLLFTFILTFVLYKLSIYLKNFISIVPDQWTIIIGLNDSFFQNHVGNTFVITRVIAFILDDFSSPFQIWFIFNLAIWALVLIVMYVNLNIALLNKNASLIIIALLVSSPQIYSQFSLPYSQTHWSLPLLVVLIYLRFAQARRYKLFGFFHLLVSVSCYFIFSSSIIFINLLILSFYIYCYGFITLLKMVSLRSTLLFFVVNLFLLALQEKMSFNYPSVDPGANIMFFGGNYFQSIDLNSQLFLSFIKVFIKTEIYWIYEIIYVAIFLLPLYAYVFIYKMNLRNKIDFTILFLLFNFYLISIFVVRYDGKDILNYDRYYMYIFILMLIPFGFLLKFSILSQKLTALILILVVIFRISSFDSNLDYHLKTSQLSNRNSKTLYTDADLERSWAIKIVQVCLEGDKNKFDELALLGNSNFLNFSPTCQRVKHWFSN